MQQMAMRYTKWLSNITNGHKINQHCPFQGPPIQTQIGIFGLKIYHLATLNVRREQKMLPKSEHFLKYVKSS
jgi:hypothetical protein